MKIHKINRVTYYEGNWIHRGERKLAKRKTAFSWFLVWIDRGLFFLTSRIAWIINLTKSCNATVRLLNNLTVMCILQFENVVNLQSILTWLNVRFRIMVMIVLNKNVSEIAYIVSSKRPGSMFGCGWDDHMLRNWLGKGSWPGAGIFFQDLKLITYKFSCFTILCNIMYSSNPNNSSILLQ